LSSERPSESARGTRSQIAFDYDLAIVGSGGAAFSAPIAARRADLRVVMVERGTVGGTCVNVGCIPSKALLAAAESRHRAGEARFPGVRTHGEPVDLGALIAGKEAIVETLRRQKYADIATRQEIEIIEGEARFLDGPALDVDGRRIEAAHYLLATGADPAIPEIPEIPGLADSGFLTSTTAMELEELPESLIVIGGGPVALEQAQLFAHLGTRVTLLVRSTLARGEEPEIVERLKAAFVSEGIRVCERAHITAVGRADHVVHVTTDDGQEYRAARLLVGAGRRPRTGGLHLDDVGVGVGPGGEAVVGGDLSTGNPRIWAAGDVYRAPAVRLCRRQARRARRRQRLSTGGTAHQLPLDAAHHLHQPDDRQRRPDRSPGGRGGHGLRVPCGRACGHPPRDRQPHIDRRRQARRRTPDGPRSRSPPAGRRGRRRDPRRGSTPSMPA